MLTDLMISRLGLNHGSVLHSVQTGLYPQPYDSQGDVLFSILGYFSFFLLLYLCFDLRPIMFFRIFRITSLLV